MKRIAQFHILLLAVFFGETTFAGETNSVLLRVAARLQPALTGLDPSLTYEYSDAATGTNSLIIRYQTDSTNDAPAGGPNTKGFVLRINLETLGAGNAVATPSLQPAAQGQTFFNCTPVGGTTNQIFWALSYGDQADKELVERVKQNLWQQGFAVRHHANPNAVGELPVPSNLHIK
jgi:hypothetical protein